MINYYEKRKNIKSISSFTKDLRKGYITIKEYNNFFLKNLKKKKKLKIFKYFSEKKYFSQIKKIQKNIKDQKLIGVPVAIKDIFNTYDMPTGMGSKILKNYQPGNDARVVSDLRLQGGIIMGKTETSEFAVHHPCETRNPINLNYSPGTSSSGSAAAVAAGVAPVAIGSQTAGSICRPASFCGIYGYKPSFGVVPRTGVLKTTDTLDTVGILARYVEDIEIIFECIAVKGHNYPFVSKYMRREKSKKNKIGIFIGPASKFVEKKIQDSFNDFIEKAKKHFYIKKYKAHKSFNIVHTVHEIIYNKSLSYYFKNEWKERKKDFSLILNQMIKKGNRISLDDYKVNLIKQEKLSKKLSNEFKKFDYLVCPTTADIAPKFKYNTNKIDHCLLFTLTGNPMISIPLLRGRNSMPAGLLVVGKKYDDLNLLNIAKKIDKIFHNEII